MTDIKITRGILLTLIFTCFILSILFFNSSPTASKALLLTPTNTETVNLKKYPGSFVEHQFLVPSNISYCNFNYGLPTDLKYNKDDVAFGPELGKKGDYRILYNVIEAKKSKSTPEITYATHVSADFVNYIPELVRNWEGYISVAAFVPSTDATLVMEQIDKYCYCLPGMSRVSMHFVFHKKLPPWRKDIYFEKPSSCKVKDSSLLQTYRTYDKTVWYPINVCRNAARTASITKYVMVSDAQLLPSEGLANKFLNMTQMHRNFKNIQKKVFVVPIFEIDSTESETPRTKKDLVELIQEEKAVYFHKLVCPHCQKFPGIEAWMELDPGDIVKPFVTVKREIPFNRWEPIYIGTNSEPLYNEKLSWEGLQDKMIQMLEMCLRGYKFIVLDGAFLVHWPGMKKIKTTEGEAWRDIFVKQNSIEYYKILNTLSKKYKPSPQCKLQ